MRGRSRGALPFSLPFCLVAAILPVLLPAPGPGQGQGQGPNMGPALAGATFPSSTQLLMQIFYESLDSGSSDFINKQLPTGFNDTGPDWLKVQFIPFGKAEAISDGDNGYVFRCEHGSDECLGNKLQACGLARLPKSIADQVKFITCVMNCTDPSSPSEDCATEVGLTLDDLETCATGREGELLLKTYANLTPDLLVYNHTLPLILFNKQTASEEQEAVKTDLIDFICVFFGDNDKEMPPACVEVET